MKKKKKDLKMISSLVIFRAFYFIFFVPPTLNLKKNIVNQLIKKIWPKKTGVSVYSLQTWDDDFVRAHFLRRGLIDLIPLYSN